MNTEYGPCSGCGEVKTPLGYVCIDCAYPDKQDRELFVTSLRNARDAAQATLKDRFVCAALPVASEMLRINLPSPLVAKEVVELAHALADEMLARRARDQEAEALLNRLPRVQAGEE